MIGKISREELEKYVFKRLGKRDDNVLVGPKFGEDAAAIKVDEKIIVVSSDPIIFAADRIGTLGIHIAANDAAASGARPRWMTVIFFLPDGFKDLDKITRQLDKEAKKLGISIVGGHSEYTPEISRPFISLTCIGTGNRFVPTSGARDGDKIILTKGAAIEATGIIATDFEKKIRGKISPTLLKKAKNKLKQISVVKEAMILSKYASSMHDPTEGGILNGLIEVAMASKKELVVDRRNIIISKDTQKVCGAV
ncbi:MAG: hydrogenase expression protein, partial [Candidatus Aenigmarchaeota archaeon]|nr:hydrogenase expression protein [Candidatus Aenigmarchaeota archaeon]